MLKIITNMYAEISCEFE